MEFSFIRMVEIVFITIIVIFAAVWQITHWIKSATSAKIREQLEKEYQEKHKRLENEYAEKMAALEKREQKAAYHLEREKSFASRWQQLIDRERKVEGKGLNNALDRLEKLKKREKVLAAQEKQVETLGEIQDEINKMLGMSNKLTKLADEVEREIGCGSFIEIHICDIGREYLEIHRNVSDLAIKALLNEREIFRNYKVER